MQPTIGPPETTPETSCDSTEPEAKRTKRSEEHNPFAVFQEVRSRRSCQPKTSRRAELRPCRSHEIRDTLDAHRQRESKWTTNAELQLLVELWGRMARREARSPRFRVRLQEVRERPNDRGDVHLKIRGKKACSAQKGPEGGALRVSGAHASRRSGSHVSNVPAAPRRRQPAGGAQASKPRSTTRF